MRASPSSTRLGEHANERRRKTDSELCSIESLTTLVKSDRRSTIWSTREKGVVAMPLRRPQQWCQLATNEESVDVARACPLMDVQGVWARPRPAATLAASLALVAAPVSDRGADDVVTWSVYSRRISGSHTSRLPVTSDPAKMTSSRRVALQSQQPPRRTRRVRR